jgi:hypothetical protein
VVLRLRPAGHGAPLIDPKPFLDGWKLLESTAIAGVNGGRPFLRVDAKSPSATQFLGLSTEQLIARVLHDPRIQIYGCGIEDVRSGQIDRRVLATLEFLATSGLRPTVSSLKCGHGYLTSSGNVSEHSTGTAVDIAAINGVPISPATQGKGSIAELTIQRLLTLQGAMKPHQIISLMKFDGADNTLAMSDHDDHIHVGWRPEYSDGGAVTRLEAVVKPHQWSRLVARLGDIQNPTVGAQPSRFAVKVRTAAMSRRWPSSSIAAR